MKLSSIIIRQSGLENRAIQNLVKISEAYLIIDIDSRKLIAECNAFIANCSDDILITASGNLSTDTINKLHRILRLSERHAAVSPRGNNLDILAFPIRSQDTFYTENSDITELHKCTNEHLPEYYIAPYLSAACIIISNRLIKKFGAFNENFNSIDDAIKDWCLRVGKFGYSSIAANRIFITTNMPTKYQFDFSKNYPYLNVLQNKYFNERVSPVEKFIPLALDSKPKILLSLYQLAPKYNGTTEHAFAMIGKLINRYSYKYDFHILITMENDRFFNISSKYQNIIYPNDIKEVYHLGITFIHILDSKLFSILDRHCLKIIQTVLDIISYRATTISYYTDTELMKKSIELSDGIITISNTVKNDILAAFPELTETISNKIQPILISTIDKTDETDNEQYKTNLRFDRYVLLFGNHYDHKALRLLYPTLKNINYNFVVVGHKVKKDDANTQTFSSGNLSDGFVEYLYNNCDALAFPSEYEGYGLPIINALKAGKMVIVTNSEINYELRDKYVEYKDRFIFFDNCAEIKSIIENNRFRSFPRSEESSYGYDDISESAEDFISTIVAQKIDYKLLKQRSIVANSTNIARDTIIVKLTNRIKNSYPTLTRLIRKTKSILNKQPVL